MTMHRHNPEVNRPNTPVDNPNNVNPERVQIETNLDVNQVRINLPDEIIPVLGYIQEPDRYGLGYDTNLGDRRSSLARIAPGATVATALALAVATNVRNETEAGGNNDNLTETRAVAAALESLPVETLARRVQAEVCRVLDVDFMHRFSTEDETGQQQFNPGAFIIPLAVGVSEQCKAKIDIEIHIPYHFARSFSEIATKNPEARAQMIAKLSEYLIQEAQNQVVIKGVAGMTETALVWNKDKNALVAGKPVVDLGKFDIDSLVFEGVASAEAARSQTGDVGERSLNRFNPENLDLAQNRLAEAKPLLEEAFRQAGVDLAVLSEAKSFAYEHNLVEREIKDLAEASQKVFGRTVYNSPATDAFVLIREYNANNPLIQKAITDNPEIAELLKKHLDNARGVNVSFSTTVEYDKETVYNVPVPLPLLLLLLAGVRGYRIPGQMRRVETTIRIPVDPVIFNEETVTHTPIRRRLFADTPVDEINIKRDFNQIYDQVNLPEAESEIMISHMVLEEVLPSLSSETKEPMIDYLDIINRAREYLQSDRRRFEVSKGSYPTHEEARRKMTEELVSMWERHDQATYPMSGIDLSQTINYRHSGEVVLWAKQLAGVFLEIATDTNTQAEVEHALRNLGARALAWRSAQGGSDRNLFVTSQLPL